MHLEIINKKSSLRSVVELVSSRQLPPDYSSFYDDILAKIQAAHNRSEESGLRILAIVLFSARRLSVDELRYATATIDSDAEFDSTGLYIDGEILRLTHNLLEVGHDGSVRFMHHTTAEYLKSSQVEYDYFRDRHLTLARICSTYVSFVGLRKPYRGSLSSLQEDYPFLQYATHNLGYHVSKCIDDHSWDVNDAKRFLKTNVPLSSLQLLSGKILTIPSPDRAVPFLEKSSTLHLAILWGIRPLVKMLLQEEDVDIESRGFKRATPLHTAARTLSLWAVELLLEHNPKVSAFEIEGRTALDFIIMRPWRDLTLRLSDLELRFFVATQIQDQKAEADEAEKRQPLSLHHESVTEAVMELRRSGFEALPKDPMELMERLRPGEEPTRLRSTFLVSAAPRIDISDCAEQIALLLVDRGVDVHSQEIGDASPLQMAALFGRRRLVEKLLAKNANPFLRSLMGLNASEIALLRAHAIPEEPVFREIWQMIRTRMEAMEKIEDAELEESKGGMFYSRTTGSRIGMRTLLTFIRCPGA
jgi:ankyrin repeat protein